jgi:hypothetical protein
MQPAIKNDYTRIDNASILEVISKMGIWDVCGGFAAYIPNPIVFEIASSYSGKVPSIGK